MAKGKEKDGEEDLGFALKELKITRRHNPLISRKRVPRWT